MGWILVLSVILTLRHGAEGCTIVELDSSGFANNAYSLLHALPMFYRRNGTFYLDNSHFNYRCSDDGGWHDFFSGEEDIVPWSGPKEVVQGERCARYTTEQVDEILHNVVQTKPDLIDFIGIKKAWRYRPWIQEHVDQQLDLLAKQKHPTIGFHIRGGDLIRHEMSKNREPPSAADMIQTFAQTYPLIRGGTCVMVGDEHARVTEAVKAAERHLKCKVLRTSPYWSKEGYSKKMHNKEGLDIKCTGTVKMLIDMELLAYADYLVASDRSKWSKILQYMRYILYDKDRSSFVDASEDHTDLYSAIRRYIKPNSVTVVQSGQVSRLQEAAGDPKRPTEPGPPRKKKLKGKETTTKKAPPLPPPPAAEEGMDEDYEYEDAE